MIILIGLTTSIYLDNSSTLSTSFETIQKAQTLSLAQKQTRDTESMPPPTLFARDDWLLNDQ